MQARRFDLFHISLEDIGTLRAYHKDRVEDKPSTDSVVFQYEDSLLFTTVRKRNTMLFDALTRLRGLPYTTGEGVISDLLYDAVVVDMRPPKGQQHVLCLSSDGTTVSTKPYHDLPSHLHENGFMIKNVPMKHVGNNEEQRKSNDKKDVTYIPFVSSASMSRNSEYLFVRADIASELMEKLSFGVLAVDDDHKPYVTGVLEQDKNDRFIAVAKLSAYLGNSLSDGSSVKELQTAWRTSRQTAAPEITLDEKTVICVDDFATGMNAEYFSEYVWKMHQLADKDASSTSTLFRAELSPVLPFGLSRLARLGKGIEPTPRNDEERQAYSRQTDEEKNTAKEKMCAWFSAWAARMSKEEAYLNRLPASIAWVEPMKAFVLNLQEKGAAWDSADSFTVDMVDDDLIRLCQKVCNTAARASFDNKGELYDGCGFADEYVFDQLEYLLLGRNRRNGEKARFDALLIRLPWVKGLLIRLNWQPILQEMCGMAEQKDAMIRDVFGLDRSMSGAHVLLTNSMMKGAKLLKHLSKETLQAHGDDPWQYYWDTIQQHDISLLIAGRNSVPRKTTRLNYQFLATNMMSSEDMSQLVTQVMDTALRHYSKPADFLKFFNQDTNTDDDVTDDKPGATADEGYTLQEGETEDPLPARENEEEIVAEEDLIEGDDAPVDEVDKDPIEGDDAPVDETDTEGDNTPPDTNVASSDTNAVPSNTNAAQSDTNAAPPSVTKVTAVNEAYAQHKLLAADPRFGQTAYMRKVMDTRLRSIVMGMMRGQIPMIRGDVRLLVPDLDAMLQAISGHVHLAGEKPNPKLYVTSPINEKSGIGLGHYYCPAPEDHKETWYLHEKVGRNAVILRNPHLSVGEDALLEPLPAAQLELYQKRYGHLTGVAMISSVALATINGADSDGDRASIVTDSTVIKSVLASVQRMTELVNAVIKGKDALQALLEGMVSSDELAEYLADLKELVATLPDTELSTDRNIAPPLIFAGSDAAAAFYAPNQLKQGSRTLHDAFWKTYKLTTEQRIGLMSLNALDAASAAYAGAASADKADNQKQTLLRFIRLWRLINGSLNTALEIDMAKTSLRPGSIRLQTATELDKTFVGDKTQATDNFCPFHMFRNAYVRQERALNHLSRKQFHSAMDRIVRQTCPEKVTGGHPLNRLPRIVWDKWLKTETELDKLQASPHLTKKGRQSQGALTFNDLFAASEPDQTSKEVREKMEKLLFDYGLLIRNRKLAAQQRRNLQTSYSALLHHLLHRYTLHTAMKHARDLLPTDSLVYVKQLFGASFDNREADEQLRYDTTLKDFVWETDAAKRKAQYAALLKAEMPDDSLFLQTPEDIYLFKQYVKYLLERSKLEDGAKAALDLSGVHTPAALRKALLDDDMQQLAGKGFDLHQLLTWICLSVLASGGLITRDVIQDGKTVSVTVRGMSEFLMLHLLGEDLVNRLIAPVATQDNTKPQDKTEPQDQPPKEKQAEPSQQPDPHQGGEEA